MNDQWGTEEHVPDRHQPTNTRREQVPGTAAAQQAYIALAAVPLTIAVVAFAFQSVGGVTIGRGAYAILAILSVIGGCGWTIAQAEARVRKDLGGKVAEAESRVRQELGGKVEELTTVLADLRDQVARQRAAYLPTPNRQHQGQRYVTAVGIQQGAVPNQQTAVDAESIAAAHRITDRLRVVDNNP